MLLDSISQPVSACRFEREGNSIERMCSMNVLVATDGSKYGQWGLNCNALLPFVKPPRVTALHVLDSRGPRLRLCRFFPGTRKS